jgi:hypothetical protein
MKKQCKRKIYKLVNPIQYAITGAMAMTPQELSNLRIKELASLEAIIKGKGTRGDWQDLVDCLNLTEVMALSGIGPEALESCIEAQEALLEAAQRYEKTGKMGLSGKGIQAVRDVLEFANLQQTSIARSEFERMIDKTRNHIKGRGKGVLVIQ